MLPTLTTATLAVVGGHASRHSGSEARHRERPTKLKTLKTAVNLSIGNGVGPRFDGIGAISGGGATSKLLQSYPPQQRDDVLDYLFRPNFAASLHILKVEIGGDGQATEGTESSHMHTETDEAYDRGYEWWMMQACRRTVLAVPSRRGPHPPNMQEAKRRNPNVTLYGLPWTFPGWVTESGKGGAYPHGTVQQMSQVLTTKTADYVARWVDGAQRVQNLTIDFVGLWNEHPPTPDYPVLLRRALDARSTGRQTKIVGPDWHLHSPLLDPFLDALQHNDTVREAIDRVGFHYPHRLAGDPTQYPVPVWSSEESSTTDTPAGGGLLGPPAEPKLRVCPLPHCHLLPSVSAYYSYPAVIHLTLPLVVGNMTATIMWNLLTSFYTTLPYFGASLMDAPEPWSGSYTVKTPIWATAHHTQFTQPGWHYLARGSGVGYLPGGGTMVTYVSPVSPPASDAPRDWTVVVEKIRGSTGPCLRDSFTNDTMQTETIQIHVGPGLARPGTAIQTWRSSWARGNTTDGSDLFQPGPAVPLGPDGVFSVTLGPDEVVTATSLAAGPGGHGRHGLAASRPPPPAPFPASYTNDFDAAAVDSDEPYLADQAGHWEVRRENDTSTGNQVLRHVCPELGVTYRGDTVPIAVLGDPAWADLHVTLRFQIESPSAGGLYVGVRAANHQKTPGDPSEYPLPQATHVIGAYFALYLDGGWNVVPNNTAVVTSTRQGSGPPLVVGLWYNLTVAVRGQLVEWNYVPSTTIGLSSGGGGSGNKTLDPGFAPSAGQFALGLPAYGLAAIDDLVISSSEKQ
eukprot:gene934-2582_t